MPLMAQDVVEVEWQFAALDTRPVLRWMERSPVPGFILTPKDEKQLDDTYFDTSGWRVHRAGFTCRVRQTAETAELTLKSMAEATGGMRSRREITEPIAREIADDCASAPGQCGASLRAVCGRQPLVPLFRLLTSRKRFELSDEAGVIGEVALDETSIPLGEEVPVRLSRVEVEVDPEATARARPFVRAMAAANGLTEASSSKFESAMIATGLHIPPVVGLGPTAVGAGTYRGTGRVRRPSQAAGRIPAERTRHTPRRRHRSTARYARRDAPPPGSDGLVPALPHAASARLPR